MNDNFKNRSKNLKNYSIIGRLKFKTPILKIEKVEQFNKKIVIVDAFGESLGRLASKVALLLTGKDNVFYTYNYDLGVNVHIKNFQKILIDKKKDKKIFLYTHSGYIGSLKKISRYDFFFKDSKKLFLRTITSMLPKNKGRKTRLKRIFFI